MLLEGVFVLCLIDVALYDISSGTFLENSTKYFVVEVGTNVSIECTIRFTELSGFDFVAVNNAASVRTHLNGEIVQSMRSRYRINKRTSGQCDFIVDFVDRKHAGKYSCKSLRSTFQQTAYFTVIDSDPVCEANSFLSPAVENDQISPWCKINSTGFMIPSMKWTKNNNVIESITLKSVTTNKMITTTSSIALQLQRQDNNATIECMTSFQWPNGSQENAPEYKHVWTHIATVLYGVRNITIQPNASSFHYGEQLMCFADGNPEPSYTWTHINTSRTWSGSLLTLSATVFHTFECKAQNTVKGQSKTVSKSVSFYISARKSDAESHDFIFGLGIGIVIGLCMLSCPLAIFIGIRALRRRRKKTENCQRQTPAIPLQAEKSSEMYLTAAVANETPGTTSDATYGTLAERQELNVDKEHKVYTPLHIYANCGSDI